jgi:hypothetical protein
LASVCVSFRKQSQLRRRFHFLRIRQLRQSDNEAVNYRRRKKASPHNWTMTDSDEANYNGGRATLVLFGQQKAHHISATLHHGREWQFSGCCKIRVVTTPLLGGGFGDQIGIQSTGGSTNCLSSGLTDDQIRHCSQLICFGWLNW